MDSLSVMLAIQNNWLYRIALYFFAGYPIIMSLVWITTSFYFRSRWEPLPKVQKNEKDPAEPRFEPFVSILIPVYNEADVIGDSVHAACDMDYPHFEVVIVNDGSNDGTREVIDEFVGAGMVRAVHKLSNEGKALAINDALPCLNGEIILIIDADAELEPSALRHMVTHFQSGRVAAVAGNPRVKNVETFLARLQLIEFTSIVSLLRRAQRVWGRVITVSGVVAAFRKSALIDVGLFSPDMPTEDIDLTWKLQKRFWDVRYEPNAVVWMNVPSTLKGLFKQRLRWARGLLQVLRRHRGVITTWKTRRMWPIFIESSLSVLWALCFVFLTAIWITSYSMGLPPIGASPIPNLWGMIIATMCLIQLFVGAWMERRYDREVLNFYPYAIYYPIAYWMFTSICSVIALPRLFWTPRSNPVRWSTPRDVKSAKVTP
jgi:poly-beta-1,6-N-acetyl-D-glucosamine synthase